MTLWLRDVRYEMICIANSAKLHKRTIDSGKLEKMQHIELSYNWTPHQAFQVGGDRLSPLRNPLMDMLQAVRESGSIAAAAKSMKLSYRHVWGEQIGRAHV